MPHYDLAIIGSGSGNSIIGPEFDDWQIAVIEESTFGGTCLNVGCIPTKMFVYPAGIAQAAGDAARLGVDATVTGVRWAQIRDRIFGRIDPISAAGRDYRAHGEANTTLYEARARFTGPHGLALSSGETLTAERIVIAAGSRATVPDVVSASGVPVHTSDTVMRIDALPERVAIIGGGFIAAEFAHVFSAFGARTTVIARSAPLLRQLDAEIAGRFTDDVKQRWDVRVQSEIVALEQTSGGIRLTLNDRSSLEVDLLLAATGRVPNSDRLDLSAAGVEVDEYGRIVVDAFQRTTAEGIWALGDVSSRYELKHVANHEARVVAHNLAHPDAMIESDHRYVPAAIFTHPEIATVGLTEQQAAASGRRFVTAVREFGATAYGWAMEDTVGVCKLIADPDTGLLLGAHLMGQEASILIQPLVQAMSFGLPAREMARGQYWIHPALTEVIENALLELNLST
jgi:mycothione reductase